MIGQTRLPFRPDPYSDELLSSWIVRSTAANGLKLRYLQRAVLGYTSVWARDVDRGSDGALLQRLADIFGKNVDDLRATTLRQFEGVLWEDTRSARSWLGQLGIRNTRRTAFGLSYCPMCLGEALYYRIHWRLALSVCCAVHGVLLRDRCPHCTAPICVFRGELGDRGRYDARLLANCFRCGKSLGGSDLEPASAELLAFQKQLFGFVCDGWAVVGDQPVYALSFFSGLRCLLRIQAYATTDGRVPEFEKMSVIERAQALQTIQAVLMDWPPRFLEACVSAGVRVSDIVHRNSTAVPFWIRRAIETSEIADRRFSHSAREVESVISYLEARDEPVTRDNVGALLGTREWYRKGDKSVVAVRLRLNERPPCLPAKSTGVDPYENIMR